MKKVAPSPAAWLHRALTAHQAVSAAAAPGDCRDQLRAAREAYTAVLDSGDVRLMPAAARGLAALDAWEAARGGRPLELVGHPAQRRRRPD